MRPFQTSMRAARTARIHAPRVRQQIRFASESSSSSSSAAPGPAGSGAITGGLVGGGVALGITYAWYYFSGAKGTLQTAKQAKGYIDSATNQLKLKLDEKTPDDTNEALKTLRDSANKYAGFVPGGKQYVDAAFQDIEAIRQQHGGEADQIVKDAYGELRDVSKKGLSLDAANEAYNVLSKAFQRLLELSENAMEQIMENHPQLKEKVGGSAEQLKELGQRIGPEAKKEVDDAWQQVNSIVAAGLTGDGIERARKLIQDKQQKVRQMGERAFEKGYEQLKPMLDSNPKIKEFVEQNYTTLKSGNVTEVASKVQSAVSSGSTADLENYLQQLKQKGQQFSSSQLTDWLNMIPGGSAILPQLQKLKDVAEKQGPEAEKLAKETMDEIKQVLDKKKDRVEQLYQSGKQEVQQHS